MRAASLLALALVAGTAAAREPAAVDVTGGLRFDAPFTALAVAGEPPVIYVGTESGHVHVSRDLGRTWISTRLDVVSNLPDLAARVVDPPYIEPLEIADAPTPLPGGWDVYQFIPIEEEFQTIADPVDLVADVFETGLEHGFDAAWWTEAGRAGPAAPRLFDALQADDGAVEGVAVLAADPSRPDVVFAARAGGPLLRSADGGDTWVPALADMERVQAVAVDPRESGHVLAGTGDGLWVSRDGGATFAPVDGAGDVRSIAFSDARVVFLGTGDGVLRSSDGGATFRTVFETEDAVNAVRIDTADARRVWVGTGGGLFVSEDGGQRFMRAGGLQFAGETVVAVAARAGQAFAVTGRDLWSSDDGGRGWTSLLFGQEDLRGAAFVGPDLWLVGASAVTAWTPRAPAPALAALTELRRIAEREPSIGQAVAAALERTGASAGRAAALHARSRWSAAVPTLHAGVALRDDDLRATRTDLSVQDEKTGLSRGPFHRFAWGAVALWDVPGLLYAADEAPVSVEAALTVEATLRATVTSLYRERRRLQLESISMPPTDTRARLLHALRMEEVTAHLNALTGDLFPPSPAW
jgi:photosystem II stability/assembly factor-like uncharacterized protein